MRCGGNSKPRVADGAANAIAALADARVRQADHRERGQTERDVDLDLHGQASMPKTAAVRMHASMPGRLQRTRSRSAESPYRKVRGRKLRGGVAGGSAQTAHRCRSPRRREVVGTVRSAVTGCVTRGSSAIADGDVRAADAVPAPDLVDSGVEEPGDRTERVAALHAVHERGAGLGVSRGAIVAAPPSDRDATSDGAGRDALAESSVAGARGITSSWPARTDDFTDR